MTTGPTSDFLAAHSGILSFLVVAIGFLAVNLVVWWVIRPSRFSEEKLTTYECGENPHGLAPGSSSTSASTSSRSSSSSSTWRRCSSCPGPWSSASSGMLAFVEGLVFIAILVVALAYVWRKGDLEWVRAEDRA